MKKLIYRVGTDIVIAAGMGGVVVGCITGQPEFIFGGIVAFGTGLTMDAVDPYANQDWWT